VPLDPQQPEFNFSANVPAVGYARWRANREALIRDLASRMRLPLGHDVEVWLIGGVRLRGRLMLQEEALIVEEGHEKLLKLQVDRVPFTYGEIESCVRTD